jgi:hypothetical protein
MCAEYPLFIIFHDILTRHQYFSRFISMSIVMSQEYDLFIN